MRGLDEAASEQRVGDLALRRYRAGELGGDERARIEARLNDDAALRARLAKLDDEQRAFAAQIPFERFAGGVERARRVPAAAPVTRGRFLGLGAAGVFAAAAAVLIVARPFGGGSINRIKGDDDVVVVRVADALNKTQREARHNERLDAGDRIRVGIKTNERVHVVVASIDDTGNVTPLYPATGASVVMEPGKERVYLPDAIEFTGKGRERLIVFMAATPLSVDAARASLTDAFRRAHNDVAALVPPDHEGLASWSFLFDKP